MDPSSKTATEAAAPQPIVHPARDRGAVEVLELLGSGGSHAVAEGLARCRAIRSAVFVDEQGVPEDLEWDGLDGEAHHFLAVSLAASPVADLGTARLRIVEGRAKAERVAVHHLARRLGVGRRLMLALEDTARRLGLTCVILHAQVTAIPFYERLGYVAHGDVFLDAGIDHREMTKRLD